MSWKRSNSNTGVAGTQLLRTAMEGTDFHTDPRQHVKGILRLFVPNISITLVAQGGRREWFIRN